MDQPKPIRDLLPDDLKYPPADIQSEYPTSNAVATTGKPVAVATTVVRIPQISLTEARGDELLQDANLDQFLSTLTAAYGHDYYDTGSLEHQRAILTFDMARYEKYGQTEFREAIARLIRSSPFSKWTPADLLKDRIMLHNYDWMLDRLQSGDRRDISAYNTRHGLMYAYRDEIGEQLPQYIAQRKPLPPTDTEPDQYIDPSAWRDLANLSRLRVDCSQLINTLHTARTLILSINEILNREEESS